MTNAVTTTTVRLVESFHGDNGSDTFVDETSNRIYQTLDGHRYVVTSWANDPDFGGDNVVVWEAENEKGTPTLAAIFRYNLDPVNTPHADGPDTDETHEAALATLGYAVERQEDAA